MKPDYLPLKIMILSIFGCYLLTLIPRIEQIFTETEMISPLSDAVVIERIVEKPVPVEVVREVAVPLDCKTDKCLVLAYLVERFGDDADDAITMINKCENSTFDQSRHNHNNNGTVDYGVMQINSIHIPKCGEGIKDDYKANIDCGYQIFQNRGWSAWSCSHVIGVKSFWQ